MTRFFILVTIAHFISSCSTTEIKRDKHSDPLFYVFIEPIRSKHEDYVGLRRALLATGRFRILERGSNFYSSLSEQDRQHKQFSNRFRDDLKYAWLKEMMGARGMIEVNSRCNQTQKWTGAFVRLCEITVTLIDINFSEAVVSVADQIEVPWLNGTEILDFTDVAQKLSESIPETFKPFLVKQPLKDYQEVSEERAKRAPLVFGEDSP